METFVGDTITLRLETDTDLSSYGTLKIKYKKPSGDRGYWTAIIDPSDSENLQVSLTTSDLDENGTWSVQAWVSQGASVYHGKWAELKVYDAIIMPTTAPPTTAVPTTTLTTASPTTVAPTTVVPTT